VYNTVDEDDRKKFVPELKIDPKAPVPGDQVKNSDEHKKKFEAEPKDEDQKKLKQTKPEAPKDFKIETNAFDDADVAEHIRKKE
jgi:hypothetical protein